MNIKEKYGEIPTIMELTDKIGFSCKIVKRNEKILRKDGETVRNINGREKTNELIIKIGETI